MQTKDITTETVLEAVFCFQSGKYLNDKGFRFNVVELLQIIYPNAHEKVIYCALEREERRRNIEYGVSISLPFLTEKGKEILK